MKPGLKRLAKHLQSRDENELAALDYLKLLNQAGIDYKGQVSSAYAQSGIGMSIGLSFDFGGLLGPGVHLVPELSAGASRTAHGLFVLSRMPSRIWAKKVRPVPYKPVKKGDKSSVGQFPESQWKTSAPITLAYMKGRTWDWEADLSAGAWVGFGAAFDGDETGATLGFQANVGGSGTATRLFESSPGQYKTTQSDALGLDVNAYFSAGVKRKAEAWLILNGKGPKASLDAGCPPQSPRNWRQLFRRTGSKVDDVAADIANAWDTHDTAIVNRGVGRAFTTLGKGLRALVRTNPSTDSIVKDLEAAIKLYEDLEKLTLHLEELIELDNTGAPVLPPPAVFPPADNDEPPPLPAPAVFPPADNDEPPPLPAPVNFPASGNEHPPPLPPLNDNIPVKPPREPEPEGPRRPPEPPPPLPPLKQNWTVQPPALPPPDAAMYAQLRIKEAEKLIKALKKAKTIKDGSDQTPVKVPLCYLDLSMIEGHFKAQAGGQFVAPRPFRDKKGVPTLTYKLGPEGYAKRIGFRYQNIASERIKNQDRTLLSTQDTVVTYRSLVYRGNAGSTKHKKNLDVHFNLITMSYRSVVAYWFSDSGGVNPGHALPNGSGVSFGLSILRERIKQYVSAVSDPGLKNNPGAPDLRPYIQAYENVMLDQLRVTRQELRACFADLPDWITQEGWDAADAFVVESSFAFIKPQKLTLENGRTDKLDKLDAVKPLLDKGGRPDGVNTKLEAIRVRFRLRSDEDNSRNLFNLGWNPITYFKKKIKKNGIEQTVERESIVPFMDKNNYDEDIRDFDQFKSVGDWAPGTGEVPDMPAMIALGVERVERVGMEGIITLHTHFAESPYDPNDPEVGGEDEAKALADLNRSRNAEMIVPPVTLFSQ